MPGDFPTFDDVKALAAAAGLTRLSAEHLEALLRATRAAHARRGSLPVAALTPADEPALTFHLGGGSER